MLNRIKRLLSPPIFPDDDDKTRIAQLLNIILLVLTVIFIINTIIAIFFNPDFNATLLNGASVLVSFALLFALHRKYVQVTSWATITIFWLFVTLIGFFISGLSITIVTSFFVLVVLAGVVAGSGAAILLTILSIAIGAFLFYLEYSGQLIPPMPGTALVNATSSAGNMVIMTVLVSLTLRTLNSTLKNYRTTNQTLQEIQASLEERIANRTRDLALAAEVSYSLAQTRDLNSLLIEATELIRERFELYHVQIYLTDSLQQSLILHAAAGFTGQELLERRHSLPINPASINGTAAFERRGVVVPDTTVSRIFHPNPLLPETRSEIAVPLLIAGQVLGVLDVQSTELGGLTEEVLPAFETLASQLAVSIENARLYAETRQANIEVAAYLHRVTREGWADYLNAIDRQEKLAYAFDLETEETRQIEEIAPRSVTNNVLEMPITVADEAIGMLQVETSDKHDWTEEEVSIAAAVVQQVAQQVESLRLLDEAERYRHEAEQAIGRLTRTSWEAYLQEAYENQAFVYDQERVTAVASEALASPTSEAIRHPLQVQGQTIGELEIIGGDETTANLTAAVTQQLSSHLENLRLSAQTEKALAQAQRRSEELISINHIVSLVSTALSLEESLQIIATETADAINAQQVRVTLLNDARTHFQIVAEYMGMLDAPSALGMLIPVANNALNKQVMSTHSTVVVEDAPNNPMAEQIHEAVMEQGIQSLAIIPLLVGNAVIGTVGIDIFDPDRKFTEEELRLAETIVFQAAAAVQNARLFEQTQQALTRTEQLYAASEQLVEANTLDEVLRAIVTYTTLQNLERAIIILFNQPWDENPDKLTVAATWAQKPEYTQILAGTTLPITQFPAFNALDASAPTLISDVTMDERINEAAATAFADINIRGIVGFPLTVGDRWFGLITGQSARPVSLADEEIRQIKSLVDQAATVIRNIQLFEEIQGRATLEQTLREMTARVYAAPDAESILRTAAREVNRVLGLETFVYVDTPTDTPDTGLLHDTGPFDKGKQKTNGHS